MSECIVGNSVDVRVVDGEGDYKIDTLCEVLDECGHVVGYGTTPMYAEMLVQGLNNSLVVKDQHVSYQISL